MSNEGSNQALEVTKVEALRLILEREHSRPVTYEEAEEVGECLITFFEVLADGADELMGENELAKDIV